MPSAYDLLHFQVKQGSWPEVIQHIRTVGRKAVRGWGGNVYGLWRSRIGMPLNEGILIVHCPPQNSFESLRNPVLAGCDAILKNSRQRLSVAGRPEEPTALTSPGVYMHRWFEIQEHDWEEFRQMTAVSWSGVKEEFDSEIVGFWQSLDVAPPLAKALMITRYENLGMWERSRSKELQVQAEDLVHHLVKRQKMVLSSFGTAMELVPLDESKKSKAPFA